MTEQLPIKYNRRVYLRVTNICNKECDFCFYRNETAPKGFMSLETVRKIMDYEHAVHDFTQLPLYVQLTGGEPSLHPQLEEIIELILSYSNVKLYLETNGSNLKTVSYLRLFKRFAGRLYLKISLNSELVGPDPANSDWVDNVCYFKSQLLPVRYAFMARYKDDADKAFLEKLIQDYNLNWKFLYPVNYDLDYVNGKTSRIVSNIIYTIDGTVLADMTDAQGEC
jgi:MoaA/NifB/PqqE/SkfB family radical SAM enzyme